MTQLTPQSNGSLSDRFLKHRQRRWGLFVPFTRYRATALYFLDRWRYDKYVQTVNEKSTDYVNWHHRKWTIQMEYQKAIARDTTIIKDIFINRVGDENSKIADYLWWVSWVWELYNKNLNNDDFVDEGFVRFCQSDLIFDEELTETWVFKKSKEPQTEVVND